MHGLLEEIRAAIHLHCPKDLDTASLLALMQEEDLENSKKQYPARSDHREFSKYSSRSGSGSDKFSPREKFVPKADDMKKSDSSKWEDRLESLKSFRRLKGLCFTCGDRWSKTHKCRDQIPLHIIEELVEVLPISDEQADGGSDGDTDSDDLILLASTADLPSAAGRKHTIRLQGAVGKHQILILIDSGSVSSFISSAFAQKLGCATKTMPARQFTVADGRPVQCNEFVPDFEWGVQGHTFTHSVHVLDIGCYDMILGADWLDLHSPM